MNVLEIKKKQAEILIAKRIQQANNPSLQLEEGVKPAVLEEVR